MRKKTKKGARLDADDDSGENKNARIRHELEKGNSNYLTIRMYSNYTGGDTTIKVW